MREPEELHGLKFAGSSHFYCWQDMAVGGGPQRVPVSLRKLVFPARVPQQEKLEVFVRLGCVAWSHIEP